MDGDAMRFWDLNQAEVEAADAAPWDGPLASTTRPFGTLALIRLTLAAAVLYTLVGVAATVTSLSAPAETVSSAVWLGIGIYALVVGIATAGVLPLLSPRALRRMAPTYTFTSVTIASVLVTFAVAAAGPRFAVTAATYIEAPLFAFYMLRRRWAVAVTIVCLTGFGVVVTVQEGWNFPFGHWLILVATVIATAVLMGILAERSDRLADSEHEARLELGGLNATLEQRVAEQVAEIDRLGTLRRFLTPQVADILVSDRSDFLDRPHRARIAVLFCDLRGFTAFTNGADPEEVVRVLDEYYQAVGTVLEEHQATIGDYAGDGIMAYLGDPLPHEDPAPAALRMAGGLRPGLTALSAEWRRLGYDLGYGVGLAFGYATIGVVGFDGRYDYKPVGGVVNLAARLCAHAKDGQVLFDHATYAAVAGAASCERLPDIELKGYGTARAYALA